ncbi:hypothetical protein GCM10010468_11440 [Actinocorallia longicatena]|uniref:Uncharacterized protein n=1 Tax=Actinocorallia longicatena TaxID=111803 RepID=A0ABP6Q3I3_9ACTN
MVDHHALTHTGNPSAPAVAPCPDRDETKIVSPCDATNTPYTLHMHRPANPVLMHLLMHMHLRDHAFSDELRDG